VARLATLAAVLAALALPPSAGAYVYWSNFGRLGSGTTIGRANLDGSLPNQSFIAGATSPEGVAVDGQHLYWTNNLNNAIGRANLDGTSPNQSFIASASAPQGVAVDGQHVYWASPGFGRIGRANLDGTSPDQSFIAGINGPPDVAVDGQHVYWTNPGSNAIGRANLNGTGINETFIPGTSEPNGVAVDAEHIYWTNVGTKTIGRANLDGSSPDQSFITGAGVPAEVAVDGQHVYWTNIGNPVGSGTTIGRANLDGSAPDPSFITGANGPYGLALDSLATVTTATTLACSPSPLTLPASASCTATVSDTAAGASAPSGTVAFSSSGAGLFTPTVSCALVGTGGGQSVCQLTYTPSAAGATTITASYAGDLAHAASGGTAPLTVLAPPGPTPLGPTTPVAPSLTQVVQSHSSWREGNRLATFTKNTRRAPLGTTFSFVLNERAHVSFAFTQRVGGRMVNGRCAAPTKKNRNKSACKRTVTPGTLAFTGHAGLDKLAFQGRISGARKLQPGRYTLLITATNSAAQRSNTHTLNFTIVR
jgi:virginiamycin B lyase